MPEGVNFKSSEHPRNDPRTSALLHAAVEVHRQLGQGFLEAVYQEALALEFALQKIPFQREAEIPIRYKGQILTSSYRADFVCYGAIIVEVKPLLKLTSIEQAQILNYLKATGFHTGLVLNFGTGILESRRYVR